jgi:hypothetical protein
MKDNEFDVKDIAIDTQITIITKLLEKITYFQTIGTHPECLQELVVIASFLEKVVQDNEVVQSKGKA